MDTHALVRRVPRAAVIKPAVRVRCVPWLPYARPGPGRSFVPRLLRLRPTHGPHCTHRESESRARGRCLDYCSQGRDISERGELKAVTTDTSPLVCEPRPCPQLRSGREETCSIPSLLGRSLGLVPPDLPGAPSLTQLAQFCRVGAEPSRKRRPLPKPGRTMPR